MYSGEIAPSMLKIAVATGKIDVWHHTDWVTNIGQQEGQVYIASRGKVKKLCIEVNAVAARM